MKVLYCIALLLIGWSSAQAKKLDVPELARRCSRRDIAYVKEQVAEFGNKSKIQSRIQGHESRIIVPRSHF